MQCQGRRLEGYSLIEEFCRDDASLVILRLEDTVWSMHILVWPVFEWNRQVELRRAFLPVTHNLLPCFAP